MHKTGWLRTGFAAGGVLALAACGHKDPVDTVNGWYHQYEGGAIAQQRPPPPGAHGDYPRVGLTPTTQVDLPSAQARQALTDRLTLQRNAGQYLAVSDGTLQGNVPPPPRRTISPITDENGSSMSVVAAGQTSTTTQPSTQQHTDKESRSAASETPVPAVTRFTPPPIKPGTLPQIGSLPPDAPQFPGFSIPRDAGLPDAVRPDYDLTDPHGTAIRFAQASDQLLPGQDGALGSVLKTRGLHDPVYIRGFGEITSFSPAEQVTGLQLALLRARVIAEALILRGVPASDIRLSAGALGRGARIDLKPY